MSIEILTCSACGATDTYVLQRIKLNYEYWNAIGYSIIGIGVSSCKE